MKRLLFILAILIASCAKPPTSLSPLGAKYYQADRGVVAIGTLQHAAIQLNKVQVCDPAPCHALLSDNNTRMVVDATTTALTTMRATPTGWAAAVNAALTGITSQLDDAGKKELSVYLDSVKQIVTIFGGTQ